jgi:hypothetical protein
VGARPKLSRVASDGSVRPMEPPAGKGEPDVEGSAVLSLADVQDDEDLPQPKPVPRESQDNDQTGSGLSSSSAWRMGSSGTILRRPERPKPEQPAAPPPPNVSGPLHLLWIAGLCCTLPVVVGVLPIGPWPIGESARSTILLSVLALGVLLLLVVAMWRGRVRQRAAPTSEQQRPAGLRFALGTVLLVIAALALAPMALLQPDLLPDLDGLPMDYALAGVQVILTLIGLALWASSIRRLRGESAGIIPSQSS